MNLAKYESIALSIFVLKPGLADEVYETRGLVLAKVTL